MRHSRFMSRARSSRAVMVAVALLVSLYGIVGFPDPDELVTSPGAILDAGISPAAADTQTNCISVFWGEPISPPMCYNVQHEHAPPPSCSGGQHEHGMLSCHSSSSCHGAQHIHGGHGCHSRIASHAPVPPVTPPPTPGDTQVPPNQLNGGGGTCTGTNQEIINGQCTTVYGEPSRCTGGLTYDPASQLCIGSLDTCEAPNSCDADTEQSNRGCPDPRQYLADDGTCKTKSREDDPDRSQNCPAGQVFYSQLGCAAPCPGGGTLSNGQCSYATGYTPPSGHSTTTTGVNGPTCQNGFQVIAAHIDSANDDDGCRPPQCDFGRGGDGWCLPPVNTDPPVVYVFGPGTVDEDERTAGFRLVLSHATTQPVSVTVATQDGTATAGSDYRAVNSRITLSVSHTVRYVSVPIINDSTYEGEEGETFMLAISEPSSNAELPETRQADTTIVDDDAEPFTGALPDFSAECVDGQITVNWRRPARVAGLNSYRYRIADNIDLFSNGEFYRTGTIRDLDQTSTTVSVSDTSLTYWAGVRTNLHNAWAETDGFICTESPPVVSLDDTSLTVAEGLSVTINASLDKAPAGAASVGLNASGGVASPGTCSFIPNADFTASAEQFTFTNATSASITLTACDDTDTDDETITLALTTIGMNGLELGSPTTVVVTIADDDSAYDGSNDGWGL